MRADLFDSLIVTNFPYPMAYAYRRVREDRESREALCAAYQQFLTFVGQVHVLDYLSGEVRRDELTQELARILERAPTAGVWLDWIEKVAAFHKKEGQEPLLGTGDVFTSRASRKTLRTLIEQRNRWAHSQADFKLSTFRRALLEMTAQIRSLHTASLFCPHASRRVEQLHVFKATRLQGDYAQPGEIEGRSSIALESDRVHLYERNSRQLLSLYPFSLYERCSTCEEKHYFLFDKVRNRKIAYSAVSGGHEHISAEAYNYLERIFRHGKPSRERPRHFSIPGEFGSLQRTLGAGDAVGPYRIDRLIKIGGMAQVYQASDTRTEAVYALKILPLEMSRDPVLVMRFDEEAHNMRKIDHPNVVKLHDLGEDFGDRYLVFDLAVGGSVGGRQCLDLSEVKEALPESEILRIGKQVCEALQHIHSIGVLHRDLKPGNLLVSGERILAADFGIARGRGESGMTLTGLPVGTPEYMSPEQVQQEDPDHRSDLYALGCILYGLATGRPPFRSDTPLTTAMYHVQASPPLIEELNPKISKGLCHIIYKLMQKAPRHRHASAREVYDDLCAVDRDPAGPQVIMGQKTPQDALEEARARERAKAKKRLTVVSGLFVLVLLLSLVGRAAWQSYRFRTLLAQARDSWAQGPGSWEETCAALYDAREIDAQHSALGELLTQVSLHGSVLLNAPGRTVSYVVEPDDLTAYNFRWPKKVTDRWDDLPDEIRIANGEELHLPVGPYRAIPEIDGALRPELAVPFCISQRVFTKDSKGWSAGRRVPPLEAMANEFTPTPSPLDFLFGEQSRSENLSFPSSVPEGFRFVCAGPFFRSETNFEESAYWTPVKEEGDQGPSEDVTIFSEFELVEDELENGFLMANETTIAQFKTWFDRFGDDFCDWMVENEKVLMGRRTIRQVKLGVSQVPLDLQLRYWAERLPDDVDAAAIESSDQLVDLLFRDELEQARAKWQAYEQRMRRRLAGDQHRSLPIGYVDFSAALAYARTQEPIRHGQFTAWIEREIEVANANERILVEFVRELSSSPAAPVRGSDFPPVVMVGWREGLHNDVSVDLFSIYIRTLYYHVYYADQVPAEAIIEWTRANPEQVATTSLREKLPEFEAALKNDHQWLYETGSDGLLLYMPLVAAYGYHNAELTHPRPYCTMFARSRIRVERERSARLGQLAVSIGRGQPDDELEEVPWDLRLEYGAAQGWDLPEDRQWEKAFRGADDRPYPWGPDFSESVLGTEKGPTPLEDTSLNDLSPHGVARLGAQVSEWVHLREDLNSGRGDFLKGGNYRMDGSVCNAGFLIRLPRNQSHRWTGFRVIQNLPAGN